jgi:altronate dehydratase
VAIALQNIKGQAVNLPYGSSFPALSDIPYSHKLSIHAIQFGQDVLKYGEVIATATVVYRQG